MNLPNWEQGFSVIYLEPCSGWFQWYPVMIGKVGFIWKNRHYRVEDVKDAQELPRDDRHNQTS